jgi:hypothetical protein
MWVILLDILFLDCMGFYTTLFLVFSPNDSLHFYPAISIYLLIVLSLDLSRDLIIGNDFIIVHNILVMVLLFFSYEFV